MSKWRNITLLGLIAVHYVGYGQNTLPLHKKLNRLLTPFKATVGIAVYHIEKGETFTLKDSIQFPMQSVYKFPLALAVLDAVDKQKMTLQQKVHVSKEELHPNTWSPLAKLYPEGNKDVTIEELLDYTVSKSDNNTCDILFALMGGTRPVESYIQQLGYGNISIKATEAEMGRGGDLAANTNWCYPSEMTRLLVDFYKGKYLSAQSHQLLMRLLTESSNSDKRLKGLLPASTWVAHKTGTGNKVVNDVGIITLPDGNHVALSVFVQQSAETYEDTEKLIAQIAHIVYQYYETKAQQTFRTTTDSIAFVLDSAYAASPFFGNVLLTHKGKMVFEKSYGYADAVLRKPLMADHSFQVASISKQFTAYGIMMLYKDGLLGYDVPVKKNLPTFPYSNITIRHLLNHTSGLPNFWDTIRPKMDTLKSNGNKDVLDYLIAHALPLQSEPGAKFAYCDIGYDFLANIIEQVSGMPYDVFLAKRMFKPLGMKQTFAYKVTDIQKIHNKHLAIGHVNKNGTFEYAHTQPNYHFVYYLGGFYGDGSVVSTARDLAIWDRALNNCTLLPCDIQNESIQPIQQNDSTLNIRENVSYGFGWFIKTDAKGKMVYHTGGHPGNVHVIYRLLDKQITFIFLSNTETPNVRRVRNRILQVLEQ